MIRVLVVDDSVVVRRFVSDVLAADPDIDVVGTAINGKFAIAKVASLAPDVVTMDVEMPELNGVEAVRQLRRDGCRIPIIMFSTLTEQGAKATLDALAAGATDYVFKPANVGSVSRSIEQVRDALVPRIKALVGRPGATRPVPPTSAPAPGGTRVRVATSGAAPTVRPRTLVPAGGYRMLVVGSSTGGPEALTTFFGALPRLPVPIAVVQHMPPVFTTQFAARLDRMLPSDVVEVQHDRPLVPGTVYLAPGDYHLHVATQGAGLVANLSQQPPENHCRPAVDVLFRTAADTLGSRVLAVILTGMGHDGRLGAQHVVDRGGSVLAQDRASSVVWGMPGAVAEAGLAEEILPLSQLAPAVLRRMSGQLSAAKIGGLSTT